MLKISESDYPNVVYVEVDGGVIDKDAEKSEAFIKEHYGENAEINALVYIKKLEKVELAAMLKGIGVDVKHWNQFRKFAVVTDSNWLEKGAKSANFLPGIEVKQFNKTKIDEAWTWVTK